ncbi:hypothetical protein SAMN05720761_11420 [Fibrobacter sp. UWCM]|uniref:hypothetical protein n=1 Tax=Fibrobacter sp. UWCM TaxID=1896208 RepID=UPI00091C7ED7|nr:hypothetical protein [Fibrobacter sp. UWCM]SHH39661.1 hypothetical protein SAMN05720761_11420 [Fibrobacter sp. UWCM]
MERSAFEIYWWEKITSASAFVDATVTALRECKLPVLLVPNDLPWRDSMRYVMQGHAVADCSRLSVETIDVLDKNKENRTPGVFLLKMLGDDTYRGSSVHTIQQHILNNNLMQGKLLWIKGLSEKNVDQWLKFCNGFEIEKRERGMIVVEMPFDNDISQYKNLKAIRYESLIRDYSVQLFIEYVLDDKGYDKRWRHYLSMLISTLCKKDVEIACMLAQDYKLKVCRIDEALRNISVDARFARRGCSEDHILNLVRNKRTEKIDRLIWTAQMQVLFPIMEIERIKWVERYWAEIKSVIETRGITVVGGNTWIANPYEAELKRLYELYKGEALDKERDKKRESRLKLMYECRNELAHLHICSHEKVYALLEAQFEDFF